MESYESPSDFGMADVGSVKSRKTSCVDCSCQFKRCFGLPCRHELKVCIICDVSTYPIELIAAKWLQTDEATDRQALQNLYATPAVVSTPATDTNPDPTGLSRALSKSEKTILLQREFSAIVDMAGNADQETFDVVL